MKSIKKTGAVALAVAVALLFAQSPAFAAVDSAAAGQLPAAIKKTKVINVGIDATYRPNEYKDAYGKAIGWEVDLFNAISLELSTALFQPSRVVSMTLDFHHLQILKSAKLK